ncbi:uncharacterized protein [Coffea arabica]|uniref:GPI mannosyltransferase 2 n=1 Tax=Coffea arabica TaxID=13443 RepID=A0ABM4WKE3_COFAR
MVERFVNTVTTDQIESSFSAHGSQKTVTISEEDYVKFLQYQATNHASFPSASLAQKGNDSWIIDSGATDHMSDAQSLRQRKRFTKGWSTVRNVSLQSGNVSSEGRACLPVLVIPFILHTGFMAATAFLVMHVQVATRFLSASPLLYWFASHVMMTPSIAKRWGYFIWVYCASYILIGSLLFSNFYPFT